MSWNLCLFTVNNLFKFKIYTKFGLHYHQHIYIWFNELGFMAPQNQRKDINWFRIFFLISTVIYNTQAKIFNMVMTCWKLSPWSWRTHFILVMFWFVKLCGVCSACSRGLDCPSGLSPICPAHNRSILEMEAAPNRARQLCGIMSYQRRKGRKKKKSLVNGPPKETGGAPSSSWI